MEEQLKAFSGWLLFEKELWDSRWRLIKYISGMPLKRAGCLFDAGKAQSGTRPWDPVLTFLVTSYVALG